MSQRKLTTWRDAGLIDQATMEGILAFEEANAKPLAVWAVVGIGALAIGLGLISLIAANWEDVPGQVRLAVHLLLLAVLAGWVAYGTDKVARGRPFAEEAAIFVFGILGLTFFGHIGQVYQTDSPIWQPIAVWLVMFAPLFLWRGESWLVALLLFAGFTGMCFDYGANLGRIDSLDSTDSFPVFHFAFVTSLPVLVAVPAAWLRTRSSRAMFWKRLEQLAVIFAVAGASIFLIFASLSSDLGDVGDTLDPGAMLLRAVMAIAAGLGVVFARSGTSGQMSGAVMAGAGVAVAMAPIVAGTEFMAGLLFMMLWAGIGAAALQAGWRVVFQLAVAAVAVRLIILSFELASDLLTSGFGLIISGLLILGVAWIAFKVSRDYAPSAEAEE